MKNCLLLVLLALMLGGCTSEDTGDDAKTHSTGQATPPNCFLDGTVIDCDWKNVSDAWLQVSPDIFVTKDAIGK